MKALKTFFLTILICFLCPLTVHASSFSSAALSAISSGFEGLQYLSFAEEGIIPIETSGSADLTAVSQYFSGKSGMTTQLTNNDIVNSYSINDLPYDLYEVMSEWDYCGSDGIKIEDLDGVQYVTFDNGYYSGEAIINSSGDVLYRYIDGVGSGPDRLVNIRQGGSNMSRAEWNETYSSASAFIQNHGFNFNTSNPSDSNGGSTYFLSYGYTNYNGADRAESIYIANQYIPGTIIPVANHNGDYISQWYTNNPNLIQQNTLMGTLNSKTVNSGTWNVNGNVYHYMVTVAAGNNFTGVTPNASFEEWALDYRGKQRIFADIGYYFDSSLLGDDVVGFSSVYEDDVVEVGNTIGLDDVDSLVTDYTGSPYAPNKAYNPTTSVSVSNPPITKDIPAVGEIVVPVPTYVVPDTTLDDPTLGEDVPITVPSEIPDLPIVSGLQNRFPFSIPWDIKNLLTGLRSRPIAPKFDISWYIRPIDYTWEFSIDLSLFDDQAEIFRNLFLIAFLIGLMTFSYKHFFGQ